MNEKNIQIDILSKDSDRLASEGKDTYVYCN